MEKLKISEDPELNVNREKLENLLKLIEGMSYTGVDNLFSVALSEIKFYVPIRFERT